MAVQELSSDLYVNDGPSGFDCKEEGSELVNNMQKIMAEAGMALAKWESSNLNVGEVICREWEERYVLGKSMKILGLKWQSSGGGLVLFRRTSSH